MTNPIDPLRLTDEEILEICAPIFAGSPIVFDDALRAVADAQLTKVREALLGPLTKSDKEWIADIPWLLRDQPGAEHWLLGFIDRLSAQLAVAQLPPAAQNAPAVIPQGGEA